jgi:acyl-CoA synthetase (AMP-forming)/AMP-acid ligase II
MTYGELDDRVRRQAGAWVHQGLTKGDVVAVMAPNCPEFAVVDTGDVVVLPYSSGTTGLSKGVMLTQQPRFKRVADPRRVHRAGG